MRDVLRAVVTTCTTPPPPPHTHTHAHRAPSQVYDGAFYGLQASVSPRGRREVAVIDLSSLAVYIPPGATVTWTLTPFSVVGAGRLGGRVPCVPRSHRAHPGCCL